MSSTALHCRRSCRMNNANHSRGMTEKLHRTFSLWAKWKLKVRTITLNVKLNIAINSAMIITMAIFLALAYYNEKRTLIRDSTRHLEELLHIMPARFDVREDREKYLGDITEWETKITRHSGYRHKIIISDGKSYVLAGGEGKSAGRNLYGAFLPFPASELGNKHVVSSSEGSGWIVAKKEVEFYRRAVLEKKGIMYLLESYDYIEKNLSRFWKIHAVHVAVTFASFIILINFITARYIRRPIRQLLEAIRVIELGIWHVSPQIDSKDEFNWLKKRFSEMGSRLENTVVQLVRAEKIATGFLTSRKLFKEINPLLNGIKANIECLKNLEDDPNAYEEKLRNIESDLKRIRAKFYVMESEIDSIPII